MKKINFFIQFQLLWYVFNSLLWTIKPKRKRCRILNSFRRKPKKQKHSFKTFIKLTTSILQKFSTKRAQILLMWKLTITCATKRDKISAKSQRLFMKIELSVLKTSSKFQLTLLIWALHILLLSRKLKKEKKIALETLRKLESLTKMLTRTPKQRRRTRKTLWRTSSKYTCLGYKKKKMEKVIHSGVPHCKN